MRQWGAFGATAVLLFSAAVFLAASWGWPLVNDAALMHYIVFLLQHGMAPYREIGDINLPGAYVPEWFALTVAPALDLSMAHMWRVMDIAAMLLCAGAMTSIAGRRRWFAGVFAGVLFALYHGRDGIGQAGQRDLWMTLLLLWGMAFLLRAMRSESFQQGCLWCTGFGLAVGAASTIKPFALPFLLCALPMLLRERSRRGWMLVGGVAAGFFLPAASVLAFLLHWHALAAMTWVLRVDLPYHAALGDRTWLQVLGVSTIRSTTRLGALLLLTALLAGGWRESLWALTRRASRPSVRAAAWAAQPERLLLLVGCLMGLVSFLIQRKGYSYQRYPSVAFLLLLAALEFTAAVRSSRRLLWVPGTAGFVLGLLLVATTYLREATRAAWPVEVTQAIEHSLVAAAGPGGVRTLNRDVQCVDVISGCTDALLHLGLVQATGSIYDEYLFPQEPEPWGVEYPGPEPGAPLPRAVAAGQARFEAALLAHAPRVIVVTAWLFPEGPGKYRKLLSWPWFNDWLAAHYTLAEQQSFARSENGPEGFRVYVRRGEAFR